jgi:Mrp family chromosome partitioning ATPase
LPPVNIVSDAVSVSRYITGMVVVAREEYIEKKELKACFRQLELSNVKILGCVMSCAKKSGGSYGRRKYGKYYRNYEEKNKGNES